MMPFPHPTSSTETSGRKQAARAITFSFLETADSTAVVDVPVVLLDDNDVDDDGDGDDDDGADVRGR